MSARLDTLRRYYLDHETDLAEKYGGKFVVLVDGGIFGVLRDRGGGPTAVNGKLDLGLFLIQEVPTIEVD
jgi:hypothetical protein